LQQNGIPARQINTLYRCNSWSMTVYAGVGNAGFQSGAPPTVGDVLHYTIANSGLPGSPITLSHVITSGDIAATSLGFSPYADSFVNQINANSALSGRGITAAYTSNAPGAWLNGTGGDGGMFFINYDSLAIGAVTVSSNITGSGPERLYQVPNGDVATNSTDPNVFNRKRAYIAGSSGTTGGGSGPTGTGTGIADGGVLWTFLPELRAYGFYNAFNTSIWPAFPAFISNPLYVDEFRAGMTTLTQANVPGAPAAMSQLDQMLNWEYNTSNPSGHILWRNTLDARLATPRPISVSLTASTVALSESSPRGTLIATATVTMSDGSPFTGTLSTSDTDFFAISGLNIVTARALTFQDSGSHTTTITASQGGQSISADIVM